VHDCERSNLGSELALARVTCTSGPIRVQYNVMPSSQDAETVLSSLATSGGVPDGSCETSTFAVGPWVLQDTSDGSGGRLLCYVAQDQSWVEWTWASTTDPSFAMYAWATREGDHQDQLYGWWTKHATLEI
jgi:hypothetical protein